MQQPKHRSHLISKAGNDSDSKQDFKRRFPERFLVRFHMTVMLLGVCASGLIASKVLFELGLRSMPVRYVIAVCASYGCFFVLMRIWLWYIGAESKDDLSVHDFDVVNAIDPGQMSVDLVRGSAGAGDIADTAFGGGSEDFGGGGATDMWGNASAASIPSHSSVASGGHGGTSGKGGGWDFDLGDEGIVLVLLALLVLVIFGAGAYLVYAAPEILAEAAFEAVLAAGLIKASRKITRRGWIGSVLRATWIPFIVVLIMTGFFGWVAQQYYPHAARIADIFKHSSTQER